ncbi:MAG: hypothetical protein M9885_07660 [Burkholderiaceae bacterium]|nr:hypothetical protein [Burkholderiaceae bacterium]
MIMATLPCSLDISISLEVFPWTGRISMSSSACDQSGYRTAHDGVANARRSLATAAPCALIGRVLSARSAAADAETRPLPPQDGTMQGMYRDRLARWLLTTCIAGSAGIAVAAPVVIPVASTPAPSASQPAASQHAASAPAASAPEPSPPESSPPAASPSAASPSAASPPAASPPAASLDLQALEEQLRETKAIGLFTKLALKNQVDDLLAQFRDHYDGKATVTTAQLRRSYDLLLMKVLSLIQDTDRKLAQSIIESREAIWDLLSDPARFSTLRG